MDKLIKEVLGEQQFQLIVLSFQLEKANARIKELEAAADKVVPAPPQPET